MTNTGITRSGSVKPAGTSSKIVIYNAGSCTKTGKKANIIIIISGRVLPRLVANVYTRKIIFMFCTRLVTYTYITATQCIVTGLVTKKITIPRIGNAESLNVGIATAIFCSEISKKSYN